MLAIWIRPAVPPASLPMPALVTFPAKTDTVPPSAYSACPLPLTRMLMPRGAEMTPLVACRESALDRTEIAPGVASGEFISSSTSPPLARTPSLLPVSIVVFPTTVVVPDVAVTVLLTVPGPTTA
ncbi:hypothetical protein D3C71_611960 [compost metagenome]